MLPILTGIYDRMQQSVNNIGVVQDVREIREGLAIIADSLSSVITFFKRLKNEPGLLLWDGFAWLINTLNDNLLPICVGVSIISLVLVATGSKSGRGWLFKTVMFYFIVRFMGVVINATN